MIHWVKKKCSCTLLRQQWLDLQTKSACAFQELGGIGRSLALS